jgi:hypothetical protein
MRITHYSFGRITVDDEIFTSDVVIYPDRINSSWWRKEGHLLQVADLKEIVKESVPFLIIGTGYFTSHVDAMPEMPLSVIIKAVSVNFISFSS